MSPPETVLAVVPRCEISIRQATMADVPFMDRLQKMHGKALGYFPTKQFEGYVEMGGVLVAEEVANTGGTPVPRGYVISRDRYLKRDELGVIYQLCVEPGVQRKLVGAALVREVFARSAYGCRLYCCWCAQDLEANYFWESMGFLPIAFRAGSSGKRRVHIFWQRRIGEDDVGGGATPYWFPSQTNQGAIREDRLVLPIPPGTHWKDIMPIVLPRPQPALEAPKPKVHQPRKPAVRVEATPTLSGFSFTPVKPFVEKPKREKKPKMKNDPRHVAAARELRDRYLEQVNAGMLPMAAAIGKYHVSRALTAPMAAIKQLAHAA